MSLFSGILNAVRLRLNGATWVRSGTGTPEAAVTGAIGDVFLRTDGGAGTAIYVKESGSGNTGWAPIGTTSGTKTLTNTTLDAEATGNVITLPFTVFWPAAVFEDNAAYAPHWSKANDATSPTDTSFVGTNVITGTLDFSDATTQQAWQNFRLPDDWTGAIDLKIFWKSTATTGNVVWQVQTGFVADGATFDPTLNAAQTVTDATQGVASRFNTATLSSLTLTGAAAGSWMWLRLFRDPAHASDTIGATASLLGVEMKYRRAM